MAVGTHVAPSVPGPSSRTAGEVSSVRPWLMIATSFDPPAADPLVWIDLEMTGLEVTRHTIVEIAVLITDSDLEIVDDGLDLVVHQPPAVLARDGRLRAQDAHPQRTAPGDRGFDPLARGRGGAGARVPRRARAEARHRPPVRELDRRRPPLPRPVPARPSTSTCTTAASTCRRSRSCAVAGTPRSTRAGPTRPRATGRSTTSGSRSRRCATTAPRCCARWHRRRRHSMTRLDQALGGWLTDRVFPSGSENHATRVPPGDAPDPHFVLLQALVVVEHHPAGGEIVDRRGDVADLPPEDRVRRNRGVFDESHPDGRAVRIEHDCERSVVDEAESERVAVERSSGPDIGCRDERNERCRSQHRARLQSNSSASAPSRVVTDRSRAE